MKKKIVVIGSIIIIIGIGIGVPEEAGLGWDYIKQFRRMTDGSTQLV